MLDRRDPEYQANLELRHHRFDQLFRAGTIGESTYLRSLFIDGMLPDEANTRLSLLKMEMRK